MSLFGAFTNSIQAMTAQGNALGVIGSNVSNVNTTGYKKQEDLFQTMLSESNATTNIFGVQEARRQLVDQQGSVNSTGSWNDLAISGQGLFVVNSAFDGSGSTLYTRAGDFSTGIVGQTTSATGTTTGNTTTTYLKDIKGNYLMGWPASNGTVSADNSLSSLKPISYQLGSTLAAQATSSAAMQLQIPAATQANCAIGTSTASVTAALPAGAAGAQTLPMTVYDAQGNNHTLNATMTPTVAGQWSIAFASADGTVTQPVTLPTLSFTNGSLDPGQTTSFAVPVAWSNGQSSSMTVDMSSLSEAAGTAVSGLSVSQNGQTGKTQSKSISVYDSTGASHDLTILMTPTSVDNWTVQFQANGGTVTTPKPLPTLSFKGDGSLADGQTTSLSVPISWTGGTTSTIAVDLSRLTQYAGDAATMITSSQNGYPTGTMSSVSFDAQGNFNGSYSNGQVKLLAKLPLATFTAPNSLEAVSGTEFRQDPLAGSMTLNTVSSLGQRATLSTGAVEASNVDLAQEFTSMIMTQRAYSSASKVFQTADEMTITARDLYR